MKTPREVLLGRHRKADEKLDAIRETVLANELSHAPPDSRAPEPMWLRFVSTAWRELVWPARRIWAAFAFVWLVLVAVNLADADHPGSLAAKGKPVSRGALLAWREQQKIFAEMYQTGTSVEAEKPKPAQPKPRTQRHSLFRIG